MSGSQDTPYRSPADVAETIPKAPWKAPWWMWPLVLVAACCVVAGGSFDVAVRTGYWGVCIGFAVASVVTGIVGLSRIGAGKDG